MRKIKFIDLFNLTLTLLLIVTGSTFAETVSWSEISDTGTTLGTANVTSSTNALTTITGSIATTSDVADLYKIYIANPTSFSVTTSAGTLANSQLFLFNASGFGVIANDDTNGTWAVLPAGNANSPLTAGFYYLAITSFDSDPQSAGGLIFPSLPVTDVSGPTGPGGASALTGWNGTVGAAGTYTLTLTGTEMATVSTSTNWQAVSAVNNGTWSDTGHWSTGDTPSSRTDAIFDLNTSYIINLTANTSVQQLLVKRDGLTLSMAGHTLTANGNIQIGISAGTSILTIDGGTLLQTAGTILLSDQTAGRLNVQNAGALQSSGTLSAGNTSGTFGLTLNLSTGGTLATGSAGLATNALASLTATVSDAGSKWTVTGDLGVGGFGGTSGGANGGAASLTINAGGTVEVSGLTKVWNSTSLNGVTTAINLNGGTFKTGTLDTAGVVSRFLNNWSSGTLDLTNANPGISATSISLGANVTLNASQFLRISGAGRTLTVGNGGSLSAFSLTVGGTFTAADQVGVNSTFIQNGGTTTISGTTKVNAGTSLNLSGGTLTTGSLDTGGILSRFWNKWASGTLNITGAGGLAIDGTANAPLGNAPTITSIRSLAVSNTINITSPNALTLAWGSLSAGTIQLAGTYTQTGGMLTAGAINQTGGSATFGGAGQFSTTSLSQARRFLAATTVGTKVLVGGGYDGTTFFTLVDIYDNSTGLWSTSNFSQGRSVLTATSAGNKAFFAGGINTSTTGLSNVVDIYDNSTGLWSTSTLTQARQDLSATSLGTKAFFAGGDIGNGTYTNVVDIYDSSTDLWSTSTLSQARLRSAATSVGTQALFAGGAAIGGAPSNVVDIYDSSTGLWSTSTLSLARQYLSATSVGTKALFAGGDNSGAYSNVVDIYDSSTGLWSTSTLSQARNILSATSVGTKAIFAGGNASSGTSNVVDIYDSSTGLWSTSILSQARFGLSAASVGTKAIFAGGRINTIALNNVDIYDFNNVTLSFGTGTGNVTAYTLSGGTLSAITINMNPNGSFTQSGGTISATTFSQSGGNVTFTGSSALTLSTGTIATYNLSGGTLTTATLTINAGGAFNWTGGTLQFSTTAQPRKTPAVLLTYQSLTIPSNATLDATNHDLMIGNSSLATIQAQILRGFNKAGNPGDPALTSATALAAGNTFLIPIDADALLGTGSPKSAIGYVFDGVAITQPHTILIKYAYIGDITLDGKIDGLDFATAAGHFGQSSPGLTNIQNAWLMGDVNLDGFVNTTDFNLMSTNAPASQLSPLGALNLAPVPEPTTLSLLLLTLPTLLKRQKRKLSTL